MFWSIIILLVIVLDRTSKILIVKNMKLGDSINIINNFFYMTYWENKGAAWGILQNWRYFFIVLTSIAVIFMVYLLYKISNKMFRISLAFIAGGAVGNLIDRIFRGSVIDFLDFRFGSYHFPIFNVADSFIVIGTFILTYYLIFVYKDKEQS